MYKEFDGHTVPGVSIAGIFWDANGAGCVTDRVVANGSMRIFCAGLVSLRKSWIMIFLAWYNVQGIAISASSDENRERSGNGNIISFAKIAK